MAAINNYPNQTNIQKQTHHRLIALTGATNISNSDNEDDHDDVILSNDEEKITITQETSNSTNNKLSESSLVRHATTHALKTTYHVGDEAMWILMDHHKMLNPFEVSDLLHFVQIENGEPQLLWFIFDAYSLIRYNMLCKNYLAIDFKDMCEFVNQYPLFTQQLMSHYPAMIDENADNIVHLFTNMYDQYCASFGKPMSMTPDIKIKDSIFIFISYTFGMSTAIKHYIESIPELSPLIVDFWIIPNRTASAGRQHEIDNNIGNIKQRLDHNRVAYIRKGCKADDMLSFIQKVNIMKCLFQTKIREAMHKDKIRRLIFIVDRRYNRETDTLYCIVPPPEYGHVITNASYDVLNMSHWYSSSNYLLPNMFAYDARIRDGHIGSATHLNGYMFNLSYLIYPKPEKVGAIRNDDTQSVLANDEKTQSIEMRQQVDLIHDDNNDTNSVHNVNDEENESTQVNDGIIQRVSHEDTQESIADDESTISIMSTQMNDYIMQHVSHEDTQESSAEDEERVQTPSDAFEHKQNENVDDPISTANVQRSTSHVKVMFSTQGMCIRFVPHELSNLFPRYFIMDADDKNELASVKNLFSLNLYDPHFHSDASVELRRVTPQLKLHALFEVNSSNDVTSHMESEVKLSRKCKSWQKIFSQSSVKKSKMTNHQICFLKQSMDLKAPLNITSPWSTSATQSSDILVQSTDYCRPRISFQDKNIAYLMMSIYDCIVWNKTQNHDVTVTTSIAQYIQSHMNLSEAIEHV
eukprot:872276_1